MVFSGTAPADPEPRRAPPVWVRPLAAIFLWGLFVALCLFFFGAFKLVLLNLLAAVAVACMLRPIVDRLPGPHWARGAIVGLGFILLVATILAGIGWLLASPIEREMRGWPQIKQHINHMVEPLGHRVGLEGLTTDSIIRQFTIFAIGGEGASSESGSAALGGAKGATGGASHDGTAPTAVAAGRVFSRTADIAIMIGVSLALIFIGNIYLLVEPRGRLSEPIMGMLGQRRRADFGGFVVDIEPRLRWWLLGVFISMTLIGVLSGIGYKLVGLNFAIPLAVFAGVCEIVPNIGAITATIVAALVAATQGTGVLIGVLVVHSLTLFIESHVIIPLVMRRAVRIPPVVTIFTIIFWAEVLGFGGLLLAIPLDLVAWTAIDRFLIHSHARAAA